MTYLGVKTRFLHDEERFILSDEKEMPLVIEADKNTSCDFLQTFLNANVQQLVQDMAKYGAILLRGFAVDSDEQFEKTVLSIPAFHGIKEACMAENGRDHVGNLQYVLHTNSVYKTGGTLYLGGFHTENYYSPDVPGYLCFYCANPSTLGGETGIINTQKIYQQLNSELQKKLEKNSFFVAHWLVSEIAERYKITPQRVEAIAEQFNLPVVGEKENRLLLMYKPNVFRHPLTDEKALQLNLFELHSLNNELRKCFMSDYGGKTWFWHRFFWRLPTLLFNAVEKTAVLFIALFHSPKRALHIAKIKYQRYLASKKVSFNKERVGQCFSQDEIKDLARAMRKYYSSCLWQKGDILLIDNKKVMHAGMPGIGPRLVRALICNPIALDYNPAAPGLVIAKESNAATIGQHMAFCQYLPEKQAESKTRNNELA